MVRKERPMRAPFQPEPRRRRGAALASGRSMWPQGELGGPGGGATTMAGSGAVAKGTWEAVGTAATGIAAGAGAPALLGATTMAVRPAKGGAAGAKPVGLTIQSPDPKGAAALAGLAHGDVVTKLDGAPLKPGQLEQLLQKAEPGTKLKLEVLRKGKKVPVEVTLGATKK